MYVIVLHNVILFDGIGVFTLQPKVQLRVSALDNSHLQVVHESLENSYTRFDTGCVQYGMWGMRWARDLVRVGGVHGVTALMYI